VKIDLVYNKKVDLKDQTQRLSHVVFGRVNSVRETNARESSVIHQVASRGRFGWGRNRFWFAVCCSFVVVLGGVSTDAAESDQEARFTQRVRPFLQKHCIGCHNDEDLEGDFSLSKVTADIQTKEDAQRWQDISKAISVGDMPLEEEPRPDVADLSHVVDWIGISVRIARQRFAGQGGQVVMRRLGRYEYENTLRDLFQLSRLRIADLIPADTKQHAFDNNGLFLDTGSAHLDGYMNAIDAAIIKAGIWDRG
jgi:hypothetical protein